ncbi:hypothetical protein JZ751_009260 [Albula glossodonta]|uniref:Uncharacterized protein n=1 Tax=Albula glossodonta TaxID=121402 RepID=A0A8T2N8B8_9TELE|nr:hypothetical protein JZ751_009260 [Albula glossodonta]
MSFTKQQQLVYLYSRWSLSSLSPHRKLTALFFKSPIQSSSWIRLSHPQHTDEGTLYPREISAPPLTWLACSARLIT